MDAELLTTKEIDLKSPELYFNRELSFIEFNERVLAEAEDKSHPLLERLKFAIIFSSNLDEFFMIRVAGLKGQISAGVVELSYDGKTPREQLMEIRKRLLPLYERQMSVLNDDILPAMEKEGIHIHEINELKPDEKAFLKNHFLIGVLPLMTPLSLDFAHPFPRIINRCINVAFVLIDREKPSPEKKIAFLQLPIGMSRFVRIDRKKGHHFVMLESIIREYAEMLFPGYELETSNTFRVTRDADIEIAEDEAEDLLSEVTEQIKHRRLGTAVVRLEVSKFMPQYLVRLLTKSLEIDETDVYVQSRPLNLVDFAELTNLDLATLKDPPFSARLLPEFLPEGKSVFEAIRKEDLMVHHPFDSFTNSTLRFINQAVDDPDVLAIKITLYRTGMHSSVVAALMRAAEKGKDVTAFVELKARFDEESNIIWAKELERVGVHVVYGMLGLKTHCKLALVVRREGAGLKKYLHLSTGNYNQVTARIYTDIGYFTAREEFGMDSLHLFNYLTGYSHYKDWKHFSVAPMNLYQKTMELIERETDLHTQDNPGMIFVKMNSLVHRNVIPALYKASQKGVQVRMLVRGICCLRPGIPGISDNIEVRSILGRFLEHSRIFYFKNGGEEEFYLSSADWMSRNLHRRVELMFPVYEKKIQKRLWELLNIYWKDNTKSWKLMPDGSYRKIHRINGDKPFSAQAYFLDLLNNGNKNSH